MERLHFARRSKLLGKPADPRTCAQSQNTQGCTHERAHAQTGRRVFARFSPKITTSQKRKNEFLASSPITSARKRNLEKL